MAKEELSLTEYRPQGMGHIVKLCGITTAGMVLVSMGGSFFFAAPLALATIYGMFRGANKAQDPNWVEARDEMWSYKIPGEKSIDEDYEEWCKQWGVKTVNQIIEPMIGNCAIANFTKDRSHPYHGLRNILIYDHDDDDIPPVTPWMYVNFRLKEQQEVYEKKGAIPTEAAEVGEQKQTDSKDLLMAGAIAAALSGDETAKKVGLENSPEAAYSYLVSLTRSPLQPVIIAGLPGSGKGVLTALALTIGVKENGLRFWLFNPKNKLDEAGYWVKAERHYLKDRFVRDENLFNDLMDVLDEFSAEASRRNNNPGEHEPFVLLLEEVNALISLFTPKQKQEFKSRVTALAGMARGANMAIWFSGQSVTLEDLGLSGKSNRAMFTALVAVGRDREGVGDLCALIGIPYEESRLQSGTHCWVSASGYSQALQCPQMPSYPSWADVPNVIDQRPYAETAFDQSALQEQISEAFTPITSGASVPPPAQEEDPWKVKLDRYTQWVMRLRPEFKQGGKFAHLEDDYLYLMQSLRNAGLIEKQRDDLVCIVLWSLERGELNAKSVKDRFHRENWYKSLHETGNAPNLVRSLFKELAQLEIGDTYNEGDRLTYKALEEDDRVLGNSKQEVSTDWLKQLEESLKSEQNPDAIAVMRTYHQVTGKGLANEELPDLLALLRDRGLQIA